MPPVHDTKSSARQVLQNLKNNSQQTFQDNCHILQICPRQRCQNMAIYMQAACWYSFDWQGEAIFGLLCSPKMIRDRGNFHMFNIVKKIAKPNSPFRSNVCTTWSQPGVNVGQLAANLGPAWLEFGSNFAQVGPKLLGGSLAQVVLNPHPKRGTRHTEHETLTTRIFIGMLRYVTPAMKIRTASRSPCWACAGVNLR